LEETWVENEKKLGELPLWLETNKLEERYLDWEQLWKRIEQLERGFHDHDHIGRVAVDREFEKITSSNESSTVLHDTEMTLMNSYIQSLEATWRENEPRLGELPPWPSKGYAEPQKRGSFLKGVTENLGKLSGWFQGKDSGTKPEEHAAADGLGPTTPITQQPLQQSEQGHEKLHNKDNAPPTMPDNWVERRAWWYKRIDQLVDILIEQEIEHPRIRISPMEKDEDGLPLGEKDEHARWGYGQLRQYNETLESIWSKELDILGPLPPWQEQPEKGQGRIQEFLLPGPNPSLRRKLAALPDTEEFIQYFEHPPPDIIELLDDIELAQYDLRVAGKHYPVLDLERRWAVKQFANDLIATKASLDRIFLRSHLASLGIAWKANELIMGELPPKLFHLKVED
jgi:hypothetical protein